MEIEKAKVIHGYHYKNSVRTNLSNINAYSAALKYWNNPNAHTSWLYGAVAIPFLFRVVENVNTAPVDYELPHTQIVQLLNNLGVKAEGMSLVAAGDELDDLRKEAWTLVRKAIDAGYTCFGRGFEFGGGETSVVQGYDETEGAYITSCWHGTKHIPWQTLGEHDGLIDVYWLKPGGREEQDHRTVRDALRLAAEFAEGKWTGSLTMIGGAAYDHWARQLRKGTVDGWYFAYNTHEWDTCRTNGYRFLLEAKERLAGSAPKALDEAIRHFKVVYEKFHQVYELFPWEQPKGLIQDKERRFEAAKLLEEAKPYDEAAVHAFRMAADELDAKGVVQP